MWRRSLPQCGVRDEAVRGPCAAGRGARDRRHAAAARGDGRHAASRPETGGQGQGADGRIALCRVPRAEEYTSELQSLMRISYDVFCLKKKNKNYTIEVTYMFQCLNM